jgi:hypothetical protein
MGRGSLWGMVNGGEFGRRGKSGDGADEWLLAMNLRSERDSELAQSS